LAYAGDVDFAKELVDILRRATAGKAGRAILVEAQRVYKDFYRKHFTQPPKNEKTFASILLTARTENGVTLCYGNGRHWSEVEEYQLLGAGQEVGEALFRPLFDSSISTATMGQMAIYALARIKGFVQGCGGETRLRELLHDSTVVPWPRWLSSDKVGRIERDFKFFDKEILPLALGFVDTGTDQKAFQELLDTVILRLKTHRAEILRKREPVKWGSWIQEWDAP
jgi:hypothetical protein